MARSDWGIGIVGLGGIANTQIQAYRNAGLKVVGGADVDEQRAKTTVEWWVRKSKVLRAASYHC